MTRRVAIQLAFVIVVLVGAACSSSRQPAAATPPILSSTKVQGRGWPFGSSDRGEFLHLSRVAGSREYGYTERAPIMVGGTSNGSTQSRKYLNSLRGPKGQIITYERIGSCCPFETKNSPLGPGLLDVYQITYDGSPTPITLYVNMYDPGELLIPQGFTARE